MKKNKGKKCTGWAIVATVERPDGTWYSETITNINDFTSAQVDQFLTEYYEEDYENK